MAKQPNDLLSEPISTTSKNIVFYGVNSPTGFSGGRYHAWLLAEGLGEQGWDVHYITNSAPSFYEDYSDPVLFPGHDTVQLELCPIHLQEKCTLPDLPCDVFVLVPQGGTNQIFYDQGLEFAKRHDARVVLLNFEAGSWFNSLAPQPRDLNTWDGWKKVSESASMILSSAEESTKWAREFYDHAPPTALFEHLYAPINTRTADTVEDTPKEKRILFLTRFVHAEHKGGNLVPELFCEAMRGYTAVFIVGLGKPNEEYFRTINECADSYGITIELLETLSEVDKWHEFKRASLVLFPSFFEGFGLPPVESQYAGTPCIVFDLPVLREISGDGLIYVPAGDTAAMREKVAEVLSSDTDWSYLREQIRPAACYTEFTLHADSLFTRLLSETEPFPPAALRVERSPIVEKLVRPIIQPSVHTGVQTTCVMFCPAEDYRLERCLARYESENGLSKISILALPDRLELARSMEQQFPQLCIEVIPYPSCDADGYYSPDHLPEGLINHYKGDKKAEGMVLLSGPPNRMRYMPEYTTPSFKKDYNYFRILHQMGISTIWTHDAAGILKHTIPHLLDDFVDRHKGKRAWILGNGPSLAQMDMSMLKDEITFGSNRIHLGFEDWGFPTTYWSVLDSLQCERHMHDWEKNIPLETTKFYPFEYTGLFQLDNACPVNFYPPGHPECKTNFMDPLNLENLNKKNNFSTDPDVVYLGHTVIYGLLQIAVIMGCDPIYLLGVDHNYKISEEDKKRGLWSNAESSNHFHKGYGKSDGAVHEFQLPEMDGIEGSFQFASDWAVENGITLKNATLGTQLPNIPLIDFNDALEHGEKGGAIDALPALHSTPLCPENPTATILVCTPNMQSEMFINCLETIEKCTQGIPYELLIFDNGKFDRFRHPVEINRAMDIAQGDVFVTLDDDVELTEGWLEAMIAAADDDVGIVGCINLNGRPEGRGSLRSVGVWVDYDGMPHHYTEPITETVSVPCSCSCCWLINDRDLRFDLRYEKYYQEGDICLQSWAKNKKVVVVPHPVYHLGQGQMEALGMGREDIMEVSARDRDRFKEHWIVNGEMKKLYARIQDEVLVQLPS